MNEIWEARREQLVEALKQAALDLSAHTGSAALMVEVSGTTPKTFVALGTQATISQLLPLAEP